MTLNISFAGLKTDITLCYPLFLMDFVIEGCLENGEIHLFGLHENSQIKSLHGDVGSCNETSVTSSTNILNYYYVIPKECTVSNQVRFILHQTVTCTYSRNDIKKLIVW